MSEDSHVVVSEESWFGRLGSSFRGIIFGLLLILGGIALLFWNEGRAVERTRSLEEGEGQVVAIAADSVIRANDGKLVHISGLASTSETLSDHDFSVSENAIKLRRSVEMYQWKENEKRTEKKKVGGGKTTTKTYTYEKTWSSSVINAANFQKPEGHENPGSMEFSGKELVAKTVALGAFQLSRGLISRISAYESLPVTAEQLPAYLSSRARVVDGSTIYIGESPENPKIGDLRVSFSVVRPSKVSIVSKQIGNTFEPFVAAAGGSVELLQLGIHSAENMFAQAHQSNSILTWVLRLVGFLLVVFGISAVLNPLVVFADVIPFLGSLLGAGVGFLAFIFGGAISLIVIAVAWIFYRPILGVALILAALGLFYFARRRGAQSAT